MDDVISRQKALGYIDRVLTIRTGKKKSLKYVRKYIEALPPAQPRKKGKWITVQGRLGNEVECDKCHSVFWYWMGNYRFCPNCGARMGESE